MTLVEMIKNVIGYSDTATQIVNKLNKKYPEYFGRKVLYYRNIDKALSQMQTEVGSRMIQNPKIFDVDRTGPLNKYSLKHVPHISPITYFTPSLLG